VEVYTHLGTFWKADSSGTFPQVTTFIEKDSKTKKKFQFLTLLSARFYIPLRP